jgi:hypothetical protein
MLSRKGIFHLKNKKLLLKYILISLISYLYVFLFLYFLIDELKLGKQLSFILVYGTAYLFLYSVQLKYLFFKKHNIRKFLRYLGSILLFYISANLFYNLGLHLKLHYLLSTALTIIILMPLRLIVYTLFVYKD